MKLKMLQLELRWPDELPLFELRKWLLGQIRDHGEPLRWSIATLEPPLDGERFRKLRVEAVVITD